MSAKCWCKEDATCPPCEWDADKKRIASLESQIATKDYEIRWMLEKAEKREAELVASKEETFALGAALCSARNSEDWRLSYLESQVQLGERTRELDALRKVLRETHDALELSYDIQPCRDSCNVYFDQIDAALEAARQVLK